MKNLDYLLGESCQVTHNNRWEDFDRIDIDPDRGQALDVDYYGFKSTFQLVESSYPVFARQSFAVAFALEDVYQKSIGLLTLLTLLQEIEGQHSKKALKG